MLCVLIKKISIIKKKKGGLIKKTTFHLLTRLLWGHTNTTKSKMTSKSDQKLCNFYHFYDDKNDMRESGFPIKMKKIESAIFFYCESNLGSF